MARNWTLTDSAQQYVGLREIRGKKHHPLVVGMLAMWGPWINNDETAWCGGFAGFIAHSLGYAVPGPARYAPLRARYWLRVGDPVLGWSKADQNCVVVFKRGRGRQPGPDVFNAAGHVAFFCEFLPGGKVLVCGGNQNNRVSEAKYPQSRILGIRKLRRRVRNPKFEQLIEGYPK